MTPQGLYRCLKHHWSDPKLRRKSIFIEGMSGIGKSEIVNAFAHEVDVELRDERVSTMEPVDLRGSLWRGTDGFTEWAPPKFLKFDPDSEGILFLDELTSATREMFAAVYGLFLERRLSGIQIPEKWMLLAAGNRTSDRGVVNQMPAPLLNRFLKVEVQPHLDGWLDEMARRRADPRIMSWIQDQPHMLHNFQSIGESATPPGEPFCTPRSIYSSQDYLDLPDDERVELLMGAIGKGGASSLESHIRLFHKLPKLVDIRRDPLGCRIPAEDAMGERYALTMLCSTAMDRETFNDLWKYVDRLGASFVVLAVRLAAKRDIAIATAKGYRDFASKHQAIFER